MQFLLLLLFLRNHTRNTRDLLLMTSTSFDEPGEKSGLPTSSRAVLLPQKPDCHRQEHLLLFRLLLLGFFLFLILILIIIILSFFFLLCCLSLILTLHLLSSSSPFCQYLYILLLFNCVLILNHLSWLPSFFTASNALVEKPAAAVKRQAQQTSSPDSESGETFLVNSQGIRRQFLAFIMTTTRR